MGVVRLRGCPYAPYVHIPHTFGHPQYVQSVLKVLKGYLFCYFIKCFPTLEAVMGVVRPRGYPYAPCYMSPVCFKAPYVWTSTYVWTPPYVQMPPNVWGHPNIRGHPNIWGCPNIWGIQTYGRCPTYGASKHMGVSKPIGGICPNVWRVYECGGI